MGRKIPNLHFGEKAEAQKIKQKRYPRRKYPDSVDYLITPDDREISLDGLRDDAVIRITYQGRALRTTYVGEIKDFFDKFMIDQYGETYKWT